MKNSLSLLATAMVLSTTAPAATQVEIQGPPGSVDFGRGVTVLPNGNFLVTDPGFSLSSPAVTHVGAVYLFNPEGLLISSLRGNAFNDFVGGGTVTILANGNFVVTSPSWHSGVGAVTWGSATTGFIGGGNVEVSGANSLVGSSTAHSVGISGVVALTNGNYVVRSRLWDNTSPTAIDAGAVTWGNGTTGVTGGVSSANSLVGTSPYDFVGGSGVVALTNGNYVVLSPNWDNTPSGAMDAGAITWGNGSTGIKGFVSASNSLVGSLTGDQIGNKGVTALTNGNFVVCSSLWDNPNTAAANTGAVTWGNGTTGISGFVSEENSLVGTSPDDAVGIIPVTALSNGNYVVNSFAWDNPETAATDAGAATWGSGVTGIRGPVSADNSLIGMSPGDNVGSITALTNGHYVVHSLSWDNTAPAVLNAGAVTWGNGLSGIRGPVSAVNSLIGATDNDKVGAAVTALTNGNYVVTSSVWNNTATAAANAGAVTWSSGTKGITGTVSVANSLVGTLPNENVGNPGVTALSNGNYVVSSQFWKNTAHAAANAGAVTWGNGSTGIKGPVTATNSLVGTTPNDFVGGFGVTALTNGHYVVRNVFWNNPTPPATSAGAITWGNGLTGIKGPVTEANSLVGTSTNDQLGVDGVIPLSNGNYVIVSPIWDNPAPATINAGAVTWGTGVGGLTGTISASNSLVGTTFEDRVGNSGLLVMPNGNYIVQSSSWNNTAVPAVSAGAVSLGNGSTGTAGHVSSVNSVLGTVPNSGGSLSAGYNSARSQLIVGRRTSNMVTRFIGDQLRSLALSGQPAPGTEDIAYTKSGSAAVNAVGSALTDFTLTGSGASQGRNRALFALSPITSADLVLQVGTGLSGLGGGLPSNAAATALHGQIFHQPNRGLFQATIKGTGVNASNNRLLLLDNGIGVSLLHRSGTPIAPLGNARLLSFTEVLQSHDQNIITLAYKLKPGDGVTRDNDEGLLFLNHSGAVGSHIAAREGQPAFGGGGDFGSFKGRAAAALGDTVHFTSIFKPTVGRPVPAVFSTTVSGLTTSRLAKSGDVAPNSGGAKFSTFTAISQQTSQALLRATLKGSPPSQNEGLYRLPASGLLTRKGDPIGGGLNIARIIRFWPAGSDQVILHLQITGTNVKPNNNQVLALCQSNGAYLILLRTGFSAPGTGPATLKALSAVDVNPVTGRYAVLGTLNGAPANSNLALWTGNPNLGDDSPSLQILRLPQLTLRKGNAYSTASTPQSTIRSITLKPAIDPTGAGGRGLAQALGASGDIALFITGDRKLTEVVLLDR